VGPSTSGAANHIRLTETPPASIKDTDLANWVAANIGAAKSDAGPPWPAPTADAQGNNQTIYSLFIPPTMNVVDSSSSSGATMCSEGAGGYHDNVVINGKPVSYAVNFDCKGFTVADVEETAAHEYVEAATDPYPSFPGGNANPTQLGYVGFDEPHLSWDIYTGFQDEVGDACEFWGDVYYQETGSFPYWVQRVWSNKAALQGHHPCSPAPAGPYSGMTLFPAQESDITVDLTSVGDTKHTTKGFKAAVGKTATFEVGYFSDGAMSPWTITYDFPAQTQLTDNNGNAISNGAATVTIDRLSGQNGEKATVTVTPTAAGQLGFQIMAITWDPPAGKSNASPRYLPILIQNQ
jgi:hypothetical protein